MAGLSLAALTVETGAAIWTWDADPTLSGIQDGPGTWGVGSATWQTGTGNTGWSNSPINDAIFGGAGIGGTIAVDGILSVGNITFQPVTGSYIIGSGTLNLSGPGGTSTITANHLGTINSTVSGSSKLAKAGNGVLVLGGTNTYSGGTDINGGTLRVTSATALGAGSGALNLASGSALELNSASGSTVEVGSLRGSTGSILTRSISGGVTLRAGSNNQTTTFAGSIQDGAGSVTLSKRGTGTLSLLAANTYSGQTFVWDGGILNIQHGTALGSTAQGTVVNSGTLQLAGGITVAGEALTLNTAGPGTLGAFNSFSGNNTWSGSITLGTASRISATTGTLTVSGSVAGTNTGLTLSGAGAINVSGSVSLGTGSLTKLDEGYASLNAVSYTGSTTLGSFGGTGAGTLSLQGAASLSNGAITIYSGALLLGQAQTISNLSLGGGANGTASELNIGSGGVVLNGDVTYNAGNGSTIVSGGGVISGGTLNMGNATRTFQIGDSVAAAVDLTVTGTLSGTNLTKTGVGTMRLSGNNSYTGVTTVSAGTLMVDSDSALGQAPVTFNQASIVLAAGARLATTGSFSLNANRGITVSSGASGAAQAVVNVASGTTLGYAGTISGSGVLAKSGAGTFEFGGSAVHTGYTTGTEPLDPPLGTTIRGGLLDLNGGTISHASSYLVAANLAGDQGNLVIRNGGAVSSLRGIVGDQVNTIGSALIAGTGSRWSTVQGMYVGNYGSGTLTLSNGGTASIANGGGTLYLGLNNPSSSGTLNIGAVATGSAGGAGILNAATVQGGGGSGGGGAATVQFNHSGGSATPYYFTRSGTSTGAAVAITGTTRVIHTAGVTVINGPNTFTGTTTINGGVLELAAQNALQSTASVWIGGGTLRLGLGTGNLVNNNADIFLANGILDANGFSETLGSLTVFETSILDFGDGASHVVFADTAGPEWQGNLMISNWSGLSAGGGTDQLRFQLAPSALQLGRIFFQNPDGFAQGTYGARLLANGEVVPVPEPGSGVIAIGATIFALMRRRRSPRRGGTNSVAD